jgi:hypothetical protein
MGWLRLEWLAVNKITRVALMGAAPSSFLFFCTILQKIEEGEECMDDSFLSFLKRGSRWAYGPVCFRGLG